MKGQAVVWSSVYSEYQTPRPLFDALEWEFHFDLDLAANADNHLTPKWLGPGSSLATDALADAWSHYGEVGFFNPPYSRRDGISILPWVRQAAAEAAAGFTSVGLLPARTDTVWWHQYVMLADEIRLIPRRIAFDVPPAAFAEHNRQRVAQGKRPLEKLGGAGFPSAVVVWRPLARGLLLRGTPILRTWDYRSR